MFVVAIIMGLACFLGAFGLWVRAKTQPEDIPMYSFWGHRVLSKRNVYIGAVLLLTTGTVFMITGITL